MYIKGRKPAHKPACNNRNPTYCALTVPVSFWSGFSGVLHCCCILCTSFEHVLREGTYKTWQTTREHRTKAPSLTGQWPRRLLRPRACTHARQQRRSADQDEATTSMHRATTTHNERIWQRRARHQGRAQIKELGNDQPTFRWRTKTRTAAP